MRKLKNYINKPPAEEKEISIYGIFLKSLGLCLVFSFILIMLYALILSFTSMSDSSMKTIIQVIMIASITVSSIYGGKKLSRKGWLFGAALGLVFTLLLVPLGIGFGQSFSLDKYFAAKILMGSTVGLVGGIIGVNLN
ncbi:MAG TPA: TIGR04086 family membrane protein [Bacillota bacterium]|nr:TIGR04086 family membrane protein [Bacillota bacterium]HOR86751.1 TIGR04086 family membrane protein [Bacillota bacterium]HPL54539.1 TIGR04086 family membrane protein [Bacillota bacterium]